MNNLPLKSKGILCIMFVRAKTEKNTQERAVSWVSAFLAQEKQKKSAHNWLQILTCDVAYNEWLTCRSLDNISAPLSNDANQLSFSCMTTTYIYV